MLGYYIFESVYRESDIRVQSSVTHEGRPIPDLLTGGCLQDTSFYAKISDGKRFSDRLWSYGNDLLLSSRAIQQVSEFVVTPDVIRHPLAVCDSKGTCDVKYEIWMPTRALSCLDPDKSDCEYVNGTDVILFVNKWVADPGKLPMPQLDIFYMQPNAWVVSQRVMNAWVSSGLTGARFEELQVGIGVSPEE